MTRRIFLGIAFFLGISSASAQEAAPLRACPQGLESVADAQTKHGKAITDSDTALAALRGYLAVCSQLGQQVCQTCTGVRVAGEEGRRAIQTTQVARASLQEAMNALRQVRGPLTNLRAARACLNALNEAERALLTKQTNISAMERQIELCAGRRR